MMRSSLLLLASLLWTVLIPSCKGVSSDGPVQGEGSVWMVESPSTRLYLCGTIHLLRPSDFPLPDSYAIAYADSQRLVFELPPGSQHDPQLAVSMREAGTYHDGTELASLLKPEVWKAFLDWCEKRQVKPEAFKSFRPWLAALTIAATEYAALGADPERGVDVVFEDRMRKDGKKGEGLETVDLQIGLFSKLSEEQQQQLLEQTLAEVKTLPDQFQRMIKAWRTGDVDDLHKMMFEEAKNYPDLMDIFLNQRNASWMNRLEAWLAGTDHRMVLVGTGHLGGDTGVISMLKAKGYKVRRVTGPVRH